MSKYIKKDNHGKYADSSKKSFCSFKKIAWYWDIRLWSPVYIIVLVLAITLCRAVVMKNMEENLPVEILLVEAATEDFTIPEPTISPDEEDIISLARLADSVAAGKSDTVKKIVMWVAINRTEDRKNGYGLSLKEELARPKQWQQYNPDGPYLESTLVLAREVHNAWKNDGARMITQDMLWFVLNSDGSITVRNQFKEGKNRAEMTFGQ